MTTNKSLENLYTSKWDEIRDILLSFNEEDPEDTDNLATHPLLIKIDEEYEKADLKIMIFGKETNTWYVEYNHGVFGYDIDMESLLSIYEEFYLNKRYKSYGRPFWNYINKIRSNSSIDGLKKIGYVWNNVLKIGKVASGTPLQGLLNKTVEHFNVIPQEIEILKPDILIFFCGHGYDNYISERVGAFSVQPIDDFKINEFCKLNFSNIPVKLAFRTYHPGYLHYLPIDQRNNIFETIIKLINEYQMSKSQTKTIVNNQV